MPFRIERDGHGRTLACREAHASRGCHGRPGDMSGGASLRYGITPAEIDAPPEASSRQRVVAFWRYRATQGCSGTRNGLEWRHQPWYTRPEGAHGAFCGRMGIARMQVDARRWPARGISRPRFWDEPPFVVLSYSVLPSVGYAQVRWPGRQWSARMRRARTGRKVASLGHRSDTSVSRVRA